MEEILSNINRYSNKLAYNVKLLSNIYSLLIYGNPSQKRQICSLLKTNNRNKLYVGGADPSSSFITDEITKQLENITTKLTTISGTSLTDLKEEISVLTGLQSSLSEHKMDTINTTLTNIKTKLGDFNAALDTQSKDSSEKNINLSDEIKMATLKSALNTILNELQYVVSLNAVVGPTNLESQITALKTSIETLNSYLSDPKHKIKNDDVKNTVDKINKLIEDNLTLSIIKIKLQSD